MGIGRRRWVYYLLVCCALGNAGVNDVQSADGAATRVGEVDADFQWMGEYVGQLAARPPTPSGPVGLQVVALGAGQFQAALLAGGLPGNGSDGHQRSILLGQRVGETVTLSGDNLTITLAAGTARAADAQGQELGALGKVVRRSALEGLAPPPYSIVLFDGRNTQAFKNAVVQDGLLQVGTELIPTYQSFQLHVEFLIPYMPSARGQGRGNSGIYLHSRYEVQVLDSFGLELQANECGALYRQRAPELNMSLPPLTWQTYDITFRAPTFDGCGNKCRPARISVLHNGVTIHDNIEIAAKTGAGQPEGPRALPIKLQDHGNPVQFRNLWLQELR